MYKDVLKRFRFQICQMCVWDKTAHIHIFLAEITESFWDQYWLYSLSEEIMVRESTRSNTGQKCASDDTEEGKTREDILLSSVSFVNYTNGCFLTGFRTQTVDCDRQQANYPHPHPQDAPCPRTSVALDNPLWWILMCRKKENLDVACSGSARQDLEPRLWTLVQTSSAFSVPAYLLFLIKRGEEKTA